MEVTDVQKSIVRWKDGNLLVTAAAGSGKTFVFVNRIAYLIRKHEIDPENILALTFTKNAAEQMRTRLSKLVGKDIANKVTMSTFHSFTYSQLKKHFPHKYNNRPIMADWFKIRNLYDIVGERSSANPHGHNLNMSATDLSSFISYQKSHMITDENAVLIDENTPYCKGDTRSSLQSAYETYCRIAKNSKSIEFDDMIMDFAMELDSNDQFLDKMLRQYKYIMVDEFQDTNNSNSFILQKLNRDNLMVVGDVNQSIYSFINADVEMIVEFENTFNNVTVKRLDRNYRSSQNIVKISNSIVMASTDDRYKKYAKQVPARPDIDNNDIMLTTYQTEQDEVRNVSQNIEGLIDEEPDLELNNIAVISRTNATLGLFESNFAELRIPVNISGGRSFFDRKEIADLISYATHALDDSNDMSLRRIFNAPNRFISKQIMSDLDAFAYEKQTSLATAIRVYDGFGRNQKSIDKLVTLFESLRDKLDLSAHKFMKTIYYDTRYEDYIIKTCKTPSELINKQEAIEKFFDMSKKFRSIEAFLAHISVIKENNNSRKDGVNLMTVHAAKGLEFLHVYGVGINDESYPHEMTYNYEEERRLLYVLVSRSIKYLHLSTFVFKGTSSTVQSSPFMVEAFGDIITESRKKVFHGDLFSTTKLM
ncbi:ATP-dependent helicase [Enterococcus mundtii]|uniref:ATP-dependent helicase n=1 Tax=Enterococcus mundtii TaxID=53346 RepID=UPI001A9604DD|nr:ATP-dependent helicase [Enterococcus mundtii]MBO1087123.1 ATP-dependent helicase [Enterococcus mundtii]